MKRRLAIILLVLVCLALNATPVFAADPPGTEVDVVVVTPGDVDLNVGINAGGDVDVTIDGVDFKQTTATANYAASKAQDAYNRTRNAFTPWDFQYYWNMEVGPYVMGQIAELQGLTMLLLDAEAKLIEGHELTKEEITDVRVALSTLANVDTETISALDGLDAETFMALSSLQERDDVIWNQLMYGAEAHIAVLEEDALVLRAEVNTLTSAGESLQAQLDMTRADHASLVEHSNYSQQQLLYYIWTLAGACVLLFGAAVVIFATRQR